MNNDKLRKLNTEYFLKPTAKNAKILIEEFNKLWEEHYEIMEQVRYCEWCNKLMIKANAVQFNDTCSWECADAIENYELRLYEQAERDFEDE